MTVKIICEVSECNVDDVKLHELSEAIDEFFDGRCESFEVKIDR